MAGRLKLGQILVNKGMLTPEQLAAALGEQERREGRLGTALVRRGFIDEETLMQVLASQLRLPVARIRGKSIKPEVRALVPREVARKHHCIPLFLRKEGDESVLVVAMEDPSDPRRVTDLAFLIGRPVRPVLIAPTDLEEGLARHYGSSELEPLPPMTPLDALEPMGPPPEETDTEPELPALSPLAAPAETDGPQARAAETEPAGFDLAADPLLDAPGDEELAGDPFDLSRDPLADDAAPELSLPPNGGPPKPPPVAAGLGADVILRALTQLLVERGLIEREEFAERVRRLAGRRDPQTS